MNILTITQVIKRTLPLAAGIFSILMVQLVDTIFIAKLGINQLTVHGITQPFNTVLIGLQVGLGIAATSIISQAIGANRAFKAQAISSLSIILGNILIILICFIFYYKRSLLFSLIADDNSNIEQLYIIYEEYLPYWLISSVASSALYFISSIYRAYGDTRTPGYIMMMSSIINLILDPILMFTFELGIKGAAIASLASFITCFLYMLIKTLPKNRFTRIILNKEYFHYFLELKRLTISTTINQILPAVSTVITVMFISSLGNSAIAFWNLLSRIEMFLLVLSLSLTMSIPPIIGKYIAQGSREKIKDISISSAQIALVSHLILALIVAFLNNYILSWTAVDASFEGELKFALLTLPLSYGPLGLCMVVVSILNALGKPRKALQATIVRLFLLYVPAIFLGTSTQSIFYTIIAAAIANILSGIYAWWLLKKHIESKSIDKN
ncbi:MATE family efflux transporter [Vibrio parahaemolyticus]|uniref:MATE family efflux transporter n=1 Tax=Vibrio parahaemolyticus TaxID=670 RepID=UPI00235EBDC3|nr:MATE family efflux transporter [Vibrio parahaemolyticus]